MAWLLAFALLVAAIVDKNRAEPALQAASDTAGRTASSGPVI
jgi:hypothetical protein